MNRFSNAGDKIQTLAVILAILGTFLICIVHIIGINKYNELYNNTVNYSDGTITIGEVDDSRLLKTTVNLFTDKDSESEDIVRISMIILMIKNLLVFWFWMLLLYAFGELCENVYELNHSSRVTFYDDYERFKEGQKNKGSLESVLTNNPALDSQKVWICPSCKKENRYSSQSCVNCGCTKPQQ